MSFAAENIRKIREQLGLTQEDVIFEFRKMDKEIATKTLSNWENGITTPNADDLAVLCEVLNKPVSYFFVQK